MLDSVGPSSIQNLGRPENTVVAQEKKALIEKEEKVKADRPVEAAQEGAEAKQKAVAEEAEEKKKKSAHTFEEGRIIFEKYNNNGDLIFRLPPAKKPVDEMA
jgi:hypothetical protein